MLIKFQASNTSPNNNLESNKEEILREKYISLTLRQKNIDDLRLKKKLFNNLRLKEKN